MKILVGVFFSLVVLGLFALSLWYVGSRFRALFELTSRRPIQLGVVLAVVGAAFAMLGAAKSSSALVGMLNVLGGYVFIFYFFALLALLGLHAVRLAWDPPPALSGLAVLALALALTVVGALGADAFSVKETELPVPGLVRGITVMHLSDVHLGHHRGRAYLAALVEETNRRKPDLVVITGDLVDSEAALAPGVLGPLSQLTAPAYFVGGNHEKYVDPKRAFQLVARQGVRVLHNEVVRAQGIQLIGLDYMNADEDAFDMHPSDDKRTIKSVLTGLPLRSDLPSVLLHHSPAGVRYVAAKGVNLMLAGHTHAGQVFPFTLFARLVFPFGPGLQHEDDTAVFVSQGAGTFMTRVRLGTSNEINLLRLLPGK